MSDAPSIVWLRQDLRLSDNPALHAAAEIDRPLIALYVLDDESPGRWRLGAASRWWLHHSLAALAGALAKYNVPLILRRGDAEATIQQVVNETGAVFVFWNRCYEPYAMERDGKIKRGLNAHGVDAKSFNATLLFEPWTIQTKSGEPFKVFTPFWRACQQQRARSPLGAPKRLRGAVVAPPSEHLDSWKLLPSQPNWARGFPWQPGEASAQKTLADFVSTRLADYPTHRDLLDSQNTSRLSAHLHFGELSSAQIVAAVGDAPGGEKYLSEIGWREFAHHLLYHWPKLPEQNWKESFDRFPWRDDATALEAWQRGLTGYPIVDAAMRELWTTGFMHNRARMIVASFLVKHLLLDWREGETWFWDTLVDADLANNAASWQWVAGSGADAAPYFRIFNPVTQGERFDPTGAQVRRWIPEIADLPNDVLHAPWTATASVLDKAGVALGRTYPQPIVDHAAARERALAAFATL